MAEEDEFTEPDIIPTSFDNKDKDQEKVEAQETQALASQQVPVAPLECPMLTPQEPSMVESGRARSPAAESIDSSHMSTADSGILMDNKKTTPSPTRTTPLHHHHHVHSVSGIGYVSAESSLETLPQREEDCYVKSKSENIEIAPKLIPRAVPNDYSRVHVENL